MVDPSDKKLVSAEKLHSRMIDIYDAILAIDKGKASSLLVDFDLDTRSLSGDSLLHQLIKDEGDIEQIKLAIDLGFGINSKDGNGWTALFLVRKYLVPNQRNKEIHEFMKSKGAIAKPDRLLEKWKDV